MNVKPGDFAKFECSLDPNDGALVEVVRQAAADKIAPWNRGVVWSVKVLQGVKVLSWGDSGIARSDYVLPGAICEIEDRWLRRIDPKADDGAEDAERLPAPREAVPA
ncbi:hypothetical protein [Variovorax boronicumulans]|uniref:hypothetical protein n=1 Tax=Variovorax boronicumulans TaxID=436515 RepID=UPI001C58CC45